MNDEDELERHLGEITHEKMRDPKFIKKMLMALSAGIGGLAVIRLIIDHGPEIITLARSLM